MKFPRHTELLSYPLNKSTPGYGGEDGFSSKALCCIEKGDSSNNSEWLINNHHGTHVDAPLHFVADGPSLTDFSPDFFVCSNPTVVNLNETKNNTLITPNHLEEQMRDHNTDLLLIKTGFENKRNHQDYWKFNPGIHPDTGKWLRKNFPVLKMIGFDFISLTSYQNRELGKLAHLEFLDPKKTGKPILIIEDMKLSSLDHTPSTIIVSPLFVSDTNGSPVTVWSFK